MILTVGGAIISPNQQQNSELLEKAFTRAKRLSDFVGLFVSLVFLSGVIQYCVRSVNFKRHSWFDNISLIVTALACIFLWGNLFNSTLEIALLFLRKAAPASRILKVLVLGITIFVYLCLTMTSHQIVDALSKNFPLAPG